MWNGCDLSAFHTNSPSSCFSASATSLSLNIFCPKLSCAACEQTARSGRRQPDRQGICRPAWLGQVVFHLKHPLTSLYRPCNGMQVHTEQLVQVQTKTSNLGNECRHAGTGSGSTGLSQPIHAAQSCPGCRRQDVIIALCQQPRIDLCPLSTSRSLVYDYASLQPDATGCSLPSLCLHNVRQGSCFQVVAFSTRAV